MSNIGNLSAGHLDRICGLFTGTPTLDRISRVAADIKAIDQQEALAQAQEAYSEMWEMSERLAERVRTLRSLGHRDSREARVLEILDVAVKGLEAEGLGI